MDSREKGIWHYLVQQEKPLDSLGLLSTALERFLEGQLSEYSLPKPGEGSPHSCILMQLLMVKYPPSPKAHSLPSVFRGPRSLDKPQHQPPAPFPSSSCSVNPGRLDHASFWAASHSVPAVSISKIRTSRTTLMDLLESLAWSKII